MVSTASRVSYTDVEGADDLLTPEFLGLYRGGIRQVRRSRARGA